MKNKICAGIITFNPNMQRLIKNIQVLKKQCNDIVIIDNSSKNINEIKAISNQLDFYLISLDKNYGIAKALNILMNYADTLSYEWVLSLDQDTIVANNLIYEYKKYLNLNKIGALSCNIKKLNEKITNERTEREYEEIDRCPTSGFLCNIKVFKKTRGYNEWMFIDYVDYDICMKIKLEDYKIYKINSTYILQDLGKLKINKTLFFVGNMLNLKKIVNFSHTYNHSPIRNYYFVRNSLYYINKYKKYINYKNEYKKIIKWEIKKILLESNKYANIKALSKGIKDYKGI